MSTFGALQTAFSGLRAARAAMDLTGQNVANIGTEGYTRQRVTQSSVGSAAASNVFRTGVNIGQGVRVDGIARLSDSILDNRVRAASSTSGYWSVTASALSTIEASLSEPGENGLSAALSNFWSAWQNLANNPGEPGPGSTVLTEGRQIASRLEAGYTEAAAGWSDERSATATTVATINDTAAQVARLNDQIRRSVAAGGAANELLDQRDVLVTRLTALTGASVRDNGDSTIDVVLGGNALVAGTSARTLAVQGPTRLEQVAPGDRVHIVWSDEGVVEVDGGELAGRLAVLAPADSTGSGGPWAEAAELYNRLAEKIADLVNTAHRSGRTPSGGPGGDFFGVAVDVPPALALSVAPTDVSEIAAALPGKGAADGGVADEIAQFAIRTDGPGADWAAYVVQIGVLSRSTTQQAALSEHALTTATTAQYSQAGVDIDEETANLLTYQYAYQGAARVMTAIDEMLDMLINRTGIVGR